MTKETTEGTKIEVVPDQLIAYLAECNIYDPRTLTDIPELLKDEANLTYVDSRNAVFLEISSTEYPDFSEEEIRIKKLFDLRSIPLYVIESGSIPDRAYLEARLHDAPLHDDIIRQGPYSHGEKLTMALDYRMGLIDARSGSNLDSLSDIAYYSIHGVPQKIMHEIDREKRNDSEFEKNYIDTLENMLVVIPRIITMAVMDPTEDFNWIPKEDNIELLKGITKRPIIFQNSADQYERRREFMEKSSLMWKQIADTVSSRIMYKE